MDTNDKSDNRLNAGKTIPEADKPVAKKQPQTSVKTTETKQAIVSKKTTGTKPAIAKKIVKTQESVAKNTEKPQPVETAITDKVVNKAIVQVAAGEKKQTAKPARKRPPSRNKPKKEAQPVENIAGKNVPATATTIATAEQHSTLQDSGQDSEQDSNTSKKPVSQNKPAYRHPHPKAKRAIPQTTRTAPLASPSDQNERTDMLEENADTAEINQENGVANTDSLHKQKHKGKDTKADVAQPQKQQAEKSAKKGHSKLFISVQVGEQVEVVVAEEGVIQEYYVEMDHQAKTKGNIYKGVVSNIDANLQAAFINYGHSKNGFLQIDEVHPEYYLQKNDKVKGKKYPPIQKVLRPGQEVLVQIVKEPTGGKGAFVTTYISIPGRFLVLTPGVEQIGVSRKVDDESERTRLRELLEGVQVGEGLGLIVRTVSAGTSKATVQKDLQFLKRVWKDVRKKGLEETAPSLIYQEPGLASRAVRDYLSEDVTEVWVDDEAMHAKVLDYVTLLFPRKTNLVKLHKDLDHTMWERFSIQRQLDQVYSREVRLPSGGRLAFDQTEALMAIDINSGRISGKSNFETMALRTNIEAAEAIAQQLRLRDVGGQIVIDFIEMKDQGHIREVENTMRVAMKTDRARHDISKMSRFGLLEVVRQRTASSALAITTEPCSHCQGTGIRRNIEWQAQQTLRELSKQLRVLPKGQQARTFVFATALELVLYILNHKRERLVELEQLFSTHIELVAG